MAGDTEEAKARRSFGESSAESESQTLTSEVGKN
jgi:hypothetical protein